MISKIIYKSAKSPNHQNTKTQKHRK